MLAARSRLAATLGPVTNGHPHDGHPRDDGTGGGRPRRVRIIGASGSGKTTLGREAARRLGVAHLELDEVFWDRDWEFRDVGEARGLVRDFAAAHPAGWVADGNWTTRLGGLMDRGSDVAPDLVVWLDPPRWLVLSGVVRRTLWRGVMREELWHGNRERPASWFSRRPEENIMLWSWHAVPTQRERLGGRVGEPGFLRLGSRREVRTWLASLGPEP